MTGFSTSGGSLFITQNGGTANSFAFLLGLGFKFDLGAKLSLLANIDYFSTSPEYRNIDGIIIENGFTSFERLNYKQDIKTLNLSIGLAYNF